MNGKVPVACNQSRGMIAFCLNVRGSEMSETRNSLLDHQICITAWDLWRAGAGLTACERWCYPAGAAVNWRFW